MPIKSGLANTTTYVQNFINTSFDQVKAVYDDLTNINLVAAEITAVANIGAISDFVSLEANINLAVAQPNTAMKAPCRAASTANLTLTNEQTVDGIALVALDRCLVKNQTDTSENGIYIVVDGGAWTRAIDYDNGIDNIVDVVTGTTVPVNFGTANTLTWWVLTNVGTIVIGTTGLTFLEGLVDVAIAATATITNEATDTTNFILFSNSATGNNNIRSNTGLTYNSSTGVMVVTGLTISGLVTLSGATPLQLTNVAGEMTFDSRTGEDGTYTSKINWNGSAGHGGGLSISRGIQFVGGVQEYATTGDGACQLIFMTDTIDGRTILQTKDNSGSAGSTVGTFDAVYTQFGSVGTHRFDVVGTTEFEILAGQVNVDNILNLEGGALKFPATQVASSDVNTLDDYQEGTFTVTLVPSTSGTITVLASSNTLAYTKVGRVCHVQGEVTIDTVSSPLGTVLLSTLPFASASLLEDSDLMVFTFYGNDFNAIADGFNKAYISNGITGVTLSKADGTNIGSEFVAGTDIYFNFSYITA